MHLIQNEQSLAMCLNAGIVDHVPKLTCWHEAPKLHFNNAGMILSLVTGISLAGHFGA